MHGETGLRPLLNRADADLIAFEPTGGSSVPIPADWFPMAATPLDGDSPLDHLDQASLGLAVATFERAKRAGHAAATVTMAGGEERRLEIFDLTERSGCFAAVILPTGVSADHAAEVTTLVPNQTTYTLNATGVVLQVGPEFGRMFGWANEEVVGRSSLDFIHADDHENGIINWVNLLEQPNKQVRLRQRLRTKTGGWIWCELTETNLLDQPGAHCVASQIVDVSREMAAQAALQEREQLLERLNQALPTGVLQLTADGRVAVRNQRWHELVGSGEEEGLAGLINRLSDPDPVNAAIQQAWSRGLDADLSISLEGDGQCRFGKLHLRPLHQDGEATGLLLTLEDVTKLQTYQLELAEQTRRDPLTGAYNRLGIEALIGEGSGEGPVDLRGLIVLFIDLDGFKAVNDRFGHLTGDRVLQAVAEAVRGLLRAGDQLARMGGDEFLVILGPKATPASGPAIAARIGDALSSIGATFDEDLSVGASIGVAVGEAGDGFDSILKRADADMYRRKTERREQVAQNGELPPPRKERRK
ncbi:MAG: sensor domain-containing diguanylate cyclase [Actinomycetota bacterium]